MDSRISAVVLTKNSAKYIGRCLQALARFSEVVLLDNGSSDATLQISQQFAYVKIYQREFCGFGPLKNIAAELAVNDWVLFVDSDEVLSAELVDNLLQLKLDPQHVYRFYRKNYYANLLIDGCSWDNDYVTRLYHRKITRFNDNQVHESVLSQHLQIQQLPPESGFIYHFPYANTAQLMTKLEHYATLYAQNKVGLKRVSLWTLPLRALLAFIKSYLLKRGLLYGYEGFVISSYNAMGVYIKYLKLYELSQKCNLALAVPLAADLSGLKQLVGQLNQQKFLAEPVLFILPGAVLAADQLAVFKQQQQQLIVTSQLLSLTGQKPQQLIQEYLTKHPGLDGVIYFKPSADFACPQLSAKARRAFRRCRSFGAAELIRR